MPGGGVGRGDPCWKLEDEGLISVLLCVPVTSGIMSFGANGKSEFEAFCESVATTTSPFFHSHPPWSAVRSLGLWNRLYCHYFRGLTGQWRPEDWQAGRAVLGPAGTGTFGGWDHTAGGWTAFLAHAYAWTSPGELGSWPVSRKGTIWKVCGFSFFLSFVFFFFLRLPKQKK